MTLLLLIELSPCAGQCVCSGKFLGPRPDMRLRRSGFGRSGIAIAVLVEDVGITDLALAMLHLLALHFGWDGSFMPWLMW